jgi:hypothetical protein
MREPLDACGDNSIKELGWLWPPGAGKTTAIEGAVQWRIVCAPSNILLVGQKDDSAELWAETRLHPSFKKSEAMRPFMPENRHQNRKSTIIFPHGIYMDICGPSMSNAQEKSMPWVIIDEAWRMDSLPGRIKEFEARTHDKWNAKVFYVGQAGETHNNPDDDDSQCELYERWRRSTQRTFHFECPSCQCSQPYKWDQLKYDKVENDLSEIEWDETAKTIRYLCVNPDCEEEWRDTVANRRMLANTLVGREQYRVMNHHGRKGCEFYHCNVLAIWRIPWLKAVMEFEDAMDALKRGDKSLLRVFIQKRLAEFWKPDAHEEKHELAPGGYTIADYEDGRLIDNESGRGMFVDVQQKSTWFVLFAFTNEGVIKLLNCGELLTFEEIDRMREKYKIRPACVLLDSQYRKEYVFQQCAKYGWTAFKGSSQDSFPIHTPTGSIKAPYSTVQPVFTGSGKKTNFIYFCVNPLKDAFAEIRAGRMGALEIPDDCDPRYQKHVNAEVKRVVAFGQEKKQKEIWVRIGKRDNHMLDCSMAAVGFAAVKGWIKLAED